MVLLLPMMAQAKVVTGRVTDANGEGIISATVVVKGTSVGTVTDFDGNYTIDAPEDAILVFSYLGMKTQEVIVESQKSKDESTFPTTGSGSRATTPRATFIII